MLPPASIMQLSTHIAVAFIFTKHSGDSFGPHVKDNHISSLLIHIQIILFFLYFLLVAHILFLPPHFHAQQ